MPEPAVRALATPDKVRPAPIGAAAAQLAEILALEDVIVAAGDEQRAAALARTLDALTEAEIIYCPGSDAIPGDDAPASPVNVGQRVSALRRLRLAQAHERQRRIALVTSGEALGHRYPPPQAFDAEPPRVVRGEAVDLASLFDGLVEAGYVSDERVDEPGEVALRGQVLDVFPADAELPLRVEIVDGVIVYIRSYDPIDQRSVEELDARELGRVAEPDIGNEGVSLVDHLPGARLAIETGAEERRRRLLALVADAERRRPGKARRHVVGDRDWSAAIAERKAIELEAEPAPVPRFVEERSPMRAFGAFARALLAEGGTLAILGTARDLRFLRARVAKAARAEITDMPDWESVVGAEPGRLLALQVPLDRGFRRGNLVAVAAADLLGSRAERGDEIADSHQALVFALDEIRIGDVVVHEDHGIGRVHGLGASPAGDTEAIALEYAGGAMRLVPIGQADRLWRYGADADAVTLDRLDGSSWEKRRSAIDAAIAETAAGLIEIAAVSAGRTAPVLAPDSADYEKFAGGFAFTETRDQARAIDAVRADLASGKPMDRLVIGDVGYGKTEVALRAAALAALAGYQVAIAAPTTVLARQHLENFAARFEGTGIEVSGLSRLSTPAERRRVRAGIADGSIRVVVGTGAVAGKGVTYNRLGLVIIDEEQRFGTADKERLRKLGASHALSLSATPIPRTLQSALVGIQQLSIIASPPARRQPIRTAVTGFDKAAIRAALLRERGRAGQSFVVVPRIEDMAPLTRILGELVPELEVLTAHGKMGAAEIDETMVRFARGDGDVLLATNIIEAGLDVPRANTMVIWRADRFGLSQLHQLRGRVGRGGRRGQVILLTDPDKALAPRTLKRLRTLEAFDRLGAGFAVSAADLDMRGAGDLMGDAQAGHMKLIGIDLYQDLLGAALRAARGESVERWTPDLRLGIEGRLPGLLIPEAEIRITFYIRLARARSSGEIDRIEEELEDRFGSLLPEARTLLAIARVRTEARSAGIARIDAGPAAIALTPRPDSGRAFEALALERKGDRLIARDRIEDPLARLERMEELLATIREAGEGGATDPVR